jgi:hypothetical protein
MLKNLQNNIFLWLKAKTGLSVGFVILLAVAGSAVLVMFVFLCVTGYVWASIQLGPVFGGLAKAGVFLFIAVVCAAASAVAHHGPRVAGSRDRGFNRSESAERCDAGGPLNCAVVSALNSSKPARRSGSRIAKPQVAAFIGEQLMPSCESAADNSSTV